ncbi:MAG TPA: hypothetical protein VIJ22_09705 [Polyangiaceae bacterium]
MRLAACVPVLVTFLAVACGSAPASKAKGPVDDGTGATSGQGAGDKAANRPLTEAECHQLGQSIVDTCHGTNTRMATVEGWCRDVIVGVGSGSWIEDCEKHIKYVDAVCFASTDSVRSMMDCDSTVSR